MTRSALIRRSLRHRWRSHLGVILGAAVGSAALIGALIVGDSVRGSLRDQALARLGQIWFALAPSDRFVREALPKEMPGWLRDSWRDDGGDTWLYYATKPAGLLSLPATATREDQSARASRVHLLGVGHDANAAKVNDYVSFWDFAAAANRQPIPRGEVWLNEALAAQLRARPGDTLIFRLRKPGVLSADVPITPTSDANVSARFKVGRIRTARELGNFSLRASQTPSLNAFVDLKELQRLTGATGQVNILVSPEIVVDRNASYYRVWNWLDRAGLGKLADHLPLRRSMQLDTAASIEAFQRDLKERLRLADLQAGLRRAPDGSAELFSQRIFIDPPLARSALAAAPGAQPILTYLVNLIRSGTNATPYSMVTAAGAPWTPPDLREDEILVNRWLAEDLRVQAGDAVELTYYLPESGSLLVERTNRFRVREVLPLGGIFADKTLMPEFPGLAKAESTHDWDAGFPLVHTIREKDDQYWKQHRGTPKAFISLAAGQKLWANRFGSLTAIRLPVERGLETAGDPGAGGGTNPLERLEPRILAGLQPEEAGLSFEPVRSMALNAASQSQDFGGLFIGFSLFLIASALILMGLLFQFSLEQRTTEVGTLLALGFTPRDVRRLLLLEGSVLSLIGGLAGALGGLAYARLMLLGLGTLWRNAVGASALGFHATAPTLIAGLFAAVLVGTGVTWLVLRKQARAPARALLAGEVSATAAAAGERSGKSRRRPWGQGAAMLCLPAGAVVAALALFQDGASNPGAFFGAGALCLIGGLGALARGLEKLERVSSAAVSGLGALAARNCARRRSRSLAVAALLACGIFVILSIGVFRLDADQAAWKRSSGTGGFALIGESALPVTKDLNTQEGREFYGLDAGALEGVSVVPFRVRDGDDASCLNLNRAQRPRVLGVRPELLARRGAFSFAGAAKGRKTSEGWTLIAPESAPGGAAPEVPAIGDAASIQWALGKRLGDALDFTDERGRPFRILLAGAVANSILQGNLVIAEEEFTKRFPGEAGYRFFLVDAPSNRMESVSAALARGLQDTGLELRPAARRLAEFNAVQNTYLSTFQALGGLGLLLGSAGLGVVVLRNTLERRSELALLLAVGFRGRQVRRLILLEHAGLLLAGIAVGAGAAGVAVLPALRAAAEIPWTSLGATLGAILAAGLAAAMAGTAAALRGSLLESLRSE